MQNNICTDCALRLYNTKSYNLQGVGNPFYGNCIVVPNVDYKAYKNGDMSFSNQVKVIEDTLHLSTGDVESKLFILPLIRCNESISCEVDDNTYKKCLNFFANDVKQYDFKNILLLGSAARRFLNCNIKDYLDTIVVSHNGRRYFVNYSPLIQYSDDELFETFKDKLTHWYKCVTNGMFDYNFILL